MGLVGGLGAYDAAENLLQGLNVNVHNLPTRLALRQVDSSIYECYVVATRIYEPND